MSTADELRTLIENAKANLSQKKNEVKRANERYQEASERQRLRSELRDWQRKIQEQDSLLEEYRLDISDIDKDCNIRGDAKQCLRGSKIAQPVETMTKCNANVTKGEYVWKIEGMSWVVDALSQEVCACDDLTSPNSDYYVVDGHEFDFKYAPLRGGSGKGMLWIRYHLADEMREVIPIRYKISLKRGNGFEQLSSGHVIARDNPTRAYFCIGPDANTLTGELPPTPSLGIFGLSHDALLNSDWVTDDTMIVKFEVELRIDGTIIQDARPDEIIIPPITLSDDMASLLNSGKGSDVNFQVGGETIKAHTQILSARSEVFDKILNSGMSESITKEVVVKDCDALTFKALLQFIYTDNCDSVLRELHSRSQASDHNVLDDGDVSVQCLQNLLAASKKYAFLRLSSWCEQKLYKKLAVGNVCSVLCQAHLHEAKQLEQACLKLIRKKKHEVVVTEGFMSLSKDWPEVILKISMFDADVSGSDATSAVELLRRTPSNKRKRDE